MGEWTTINHKRPKKQPQSYSAVIKNTLKTPIIVSNLTPLKKYNYLTRCLQSFAQLSTQSDALRQEILNIIDGYRDMIATSAASHGGYDIITPDTTNNQKMIATPAEEHKYELFDTARLQRARSISWSTPIRPPGFETSPRRLLSPVYPKSTKALEDLSAKQEKAAELRDILLNTKTKRNENAQKSLAVQERLVQQDEQRKQLKDALDEKMSRAFKKREEHLSKIQKRAKAEDSRREEVCFNSISKYSFVD